MKTISLFTGAGGLDLGLEAAGFEPALCIEMDADARETLAKNRPEWKVSEPGDILAVSPDQFVAQSGLRPRQTPLVVAGPVCQPFSHAARWAPNGVRGLADPRAATLRASLDIVATALPQALVFENVAGIAEGQSWSGLQYIRSRLGAINSREGTQYQAHVLRLNSAEYGVPQIRRRTFILANREGKSFTPPEPTHGNDKRGFVTAWDAIGHLDAEDDGDDTLLPAGKWANLLPSIPEGRNYLWHTSRGGGLELFGWRTRYWTFLLKLAKDRPSWTLTAHPGPATGPFHWHNRRLSVREMCRIQTFPDGYQVAGSYQAQRRQIGNAVPCLLAEIVGREIASQWFDSHSAMPPRYQAPKRRECPPPEPVSAVPHRYLSLIGPHKSHPGPGRGPGARARAHALEMMNA